MIDAQAGNRQSEDGQATQLRHRRGVRRHRTAMFAAGTAALGGFSWVCALPAAAADNPTICYVDVTFDTGTEDLRSNSGVTLSLRLRNGIWIESDEMRGGAAATSVNRRWENVPFRGTCVDQHNVNGYRVRLISHSDPWQGADSWDLRRVHIKDGETSEVFTNQKQGTRLSDQKPTLTQTCTRAWYENGDAALAWNNGSCPW
jgi:hypothetical protein